MSYAFYLTSGQTAALLVLSGLAGLLAIMAAHGIYRIRIMERSAENVRHRPAKQSTHI